MAMVTRFLNLKWWHTRIECQTLEEKISDLQSELSDYAKYSNKIKDEMDRYNIPLWTEEEFKAYEKENA